MAKKENSGMSELPNNHIINAQVELNGNSEQLNLLIDFCGLIEDNKIRKQMFKKIQPFLRGDKSSKVKSDKNSRVSAKNAQTKSNTAIDWIINKIVYNGEIDYTSYAVFLNEHINRLEVLTNAKKIERENIEAAYEDGFHAGSVICSLGSLPEQYYEENYNDINYIDDPKKSEGKNI